jgi:hypothetical protein
MGDCVGGELGGVEVCVRAGDMTDSTSDDEESLIPIEKRREEGGGAKQTRAMASTMAVDRGGSVGHGDRESMM